MIQQFEKGTINLSGKCILSFEPGVIEKYASQITNIYLNNNRFSDIHEEFQLAADTKSLSLSSHLFSGTFTDNILIFINLTVLELSFNKITELPEEFGNKLNKLIDLNLSSNKLVSLPESIGNLSVLETLSIQQNNLKTFPQSMSKLNLKNIPFDGNDLEEFPAMTAENLKKFTSFFPYRNKLRTIPWMDLVHMNLLNISDNQIEYAPWQFAKQWKGTIVTRNNSWLKKEESHLISIQDLKTEDLAHNGCCCECNEPFKSDTCYKVIVPIIGKNEVMITFKGYFCSEHKEAVAEVTSSWVKLMQSDY